MSTTSVCVAVDAWILDGLILANTSLTLILIGEGFVIVSAVIVLATFDQSMSSLPLFTPLSSSLLRKNASYFIGRPPVINNYSF